MCRVYEEECFRKKNQLNMDFLARVCTEKTVHRVETLWFSGKEKIIDPVVRKKGYADSLLGLVWLGLVL